MTRPCFQPRDINRVTVLTNPMSGHGNAPHASETAIARFKELGIDTVQIVGRDAAHARELIDEALKQDTDALVVVGGDGVIALALQSLAGTGIPLGIVPAGTGNDHAREYRLPTGDPAAAVDVIAAGVTATVDLGLIKGSDGSKTWFGTIAATGFDSLVSDRVNRMRWPHGRMRYNVAMVAELWRLLDITMVKSASRIKLIRLFPTVFKGTHVDLDEVTTDRARTILVESPGINAYADGDYVCPLPAEISAVPGALTILVP